jgi:spore coat protein U-like protein
MIILWVLASLLSWVPRSAHAQSCVASVSSIAFGNVDPISGNAFDATGSVQVSCTWPGYPTAPQVLVCLSLTGASPRLLSNGPQALRYDLYVDANRLTPWGMASEGAAPLGMVVSRSADGGRTTATTTVYARIAANQTATAANGNGASVYDHHFGGNETMLAYGTYPAADCASATPRGGGAFPFEVSAIVVNNCRIRASGVAFGTVGNLTQPLAANGTLYVQCTNGAPYRIALDGGGSANVAARTMRIAGTDAAIGYQLFLDASRTVSWGDGTAGTADATGLGTGSWVHIPVYGRVPVQPSPLPGDFSDTVIATITF